MSQYSSRIHIKVVSPEVWDRFKDADDAELGLANIAEQGSTSFDLSDWCCVESELKGIVSALADKIGTDGVIIADTTNINVDPYAYIVYSAGYGVHDKYREYTEYCFDTDISDMIGCLNYKNHFSFNNDEMKVLNSVGIERVKEGRKFVFRRLLLNEGLEDEIFLTETGFDGRTERIETVHVGDSVSLKHITDDKTYPNKVEVFCESGSLGYLDDTAADIIAPILDSGAKKYTAEVRRVVPLSARSKRCHSAIVSVHIQIIPKKLEQKKAPAASGKTIAGSDDTVFTYGSIDEIGSSFYDGIYNGKDFAISKDGTVSVESNGKTVDVKVSVKRKMKDILKSFEPALSGSGEPDSVYDPYSAIDGYLEMSGIGEYQQYLYEVSDGAELLNNEQIAHRIKLFAKVVEQLHDEKALTEIVKAAPKKKNGGLYSRRVTQIATLFCMESDASMYVLCAVAKGESNMLVEIRKIVTSDLEKTETDVISKTNLFRTTVEDLL